MTKTGRILHRAKSAVGERAPGHMSDEEIEEYFNDFRSFLELDRHQLVLRIQDQVGDSDEDLEGQTLNNPRYKSAIVTIKRGLSSEETKWTIKHELLHIATQLIDGAVIQVIIDKMVPGDLKSAARQIYDQASDRTIEMLVGIFTRSLREREVEAGEAPDRAKSAIEHDAAPGDGK